MPLVRALHRIDDAAIDRLTTVVAAIHVRTGMDKAELGRNVHAMGVVACVAWACGRWGTSDLGVLVPFVLAFGEFGSAVECDREIGKAETIRGWEALALEAGSERIEGFPMRIVCLSAVVWISMFAVLSMAMGWMPSETNAHLVVGGAFGWMVATTLGRYLTAVPPARPGTRRATESAGRTVPQT